MMLRSRSMALRASPCRSSADMESTLTAASSPVPTHGGAHGPEGALAGRLAKRPLAKRRISTVRQIDSIAQRRQQP